MGRQPDPIGAQRDAVPFGEDPVSLRIDYECAAVRTYADDAKGRAIQGLANGHLPVVGKSELPTQRQSAAYVGKQQAEEVLVRFRVRARACAPVYGEKARPARAILRNATQAVFDVERPQDVGVEPGSVQDFGDDDIGGEIGCVGGNFENVLQPYVDVILATISTRDHIEVEARREEFLTWR